MGSCIRFFVALAILLSVGCGDDASDTAKVTSPVSGVLRQVDASPSGEIESITLETDDGGVAKFRVELVPEAVVSAEHLRLHISEKLPVSVSFAGEGDRRVAYRIDDASP
jgi:hypothetical protein